MTRYVDPNRPGVDWVAILLLVVTAVFFGLTLAVGASALFGQSPQEVRYTRPGHAACLDLERWSEQAAAREDDPQTWYRGMRSLVSEGDCWLTRDSTPVHVYPTRHPDAVQIRRVQVKADTLWWLGREALHGG